MVSAGTLALAANGVALTTIPFNGSIYPVSVSTPSWKTGDTLQVTAPGDIVKGFTASIVAPDAPTVLSPAGVGTVSVAKDWAITWTPSAADAGSTIIAFLGASVDDTHRGTLKCLANDAAGSISVPASILGHFKVGADASLAVARGVRTSVDTGNALVEVIAFHGSSIAVSFTP
jgi:hypothetical protein